MRFNPADDDLSLYETGFEGDLLNRASFGQKLSLIVESVEDPLVIALDGHWGTGKTHFLKRWVGAHKNENDGRALAVYFDAFENDYVADPLVALVAALNSRVPAAGQPKMDRVKKFAMKLFRPTARLGLALASAGASVVLDEVLDAGVEALKDEAKGALDEFWRRESGRHVAMEEFRAAIHALTLGDGETGAPLVIVIDELDRCRPDFALDVLEVVKHFFSVPNVHFILGVNLDALACSVQVRYGSQIDSMAYLQKFISFSMSLPDHLDDPQQTKAIHKYASKLGAKLNIPAKFLNDLRDQLEVISGSNHISLRDVGKILAMTALMPNEATGDNIFLGWRVATVTLIILRVIRPDLYRELTSASISAETLVELFGASTDKISETLPNGDRNPSYNRRVSLMYDTWRYICRDGVSDGSDGWSSLARIFDDFGAAYEAKKIPQKIRKDWLEQFRIS